MLMKIEVSLVIVSFTTYCAYETFWEYINIVVKDVILFNMLKLMDK